MSFINYKIAPAILIALAMLLSSCRNQGPGEELNNSTRTEDSSTETLELVAEIEGVQVTGVTVTDEGRVFATFPRWRKGVPYTLAEIVDGQPRPYPSPDLNAWDIGQEPGDKLVNVQSAVAVGDTLYVADTRNPLIQVLIAPPLIHLYDLATDKLLRTYELTPGTTVPKTYVNDLRIDRGRQQVYFTDSGQGGLMVLDLETGNSWRVLDGHPAVQATLDSLVIAGKPWKRKIPSDGIALDAINDRLLFHALSGYTLYAIPLSVLSDPEARNLGDAVETIATTPAPDGMWRTGGRTIMADLEKQAVVSVTDGGSVATLVAGPRVGWADTFSEYDGYLYFTNSKLPEADSTVANMTFPIWRMLLPTE
ncbi:sugar lactone lactonase YvrE [Lewinella aquimaris]|uniref:Sugar lactone lactonase YvrE n=1 Tax=Neolewinella aquimaris TaxID=1835722 RepID=A0A840E6C6_9BACT|nr:L-dopachrome tautomerase-related protein [Neolewinella aquimaris]MBB4079503.1 sugar lactone lactonase YvrE [Neolewinella aquimaris]